MEFMAEKLKPTFGTWGTDEQDHDEPYQNIVIKSGARRIAVVWIDDSPVHDYNSEQRQNAKLICEAGTVHHECGLSPRDLLERCKAMEAALNQIIEMNQQWAEDEWGDRAQAESMACVKTARAALAKHKEV